MSVFDRGTEYLSVLRRCGAATTVTDSEFTILLTQRYRLGTPLRDVECELASEHTESHIAFAMAADNGEQWWWVRWNPLVHEVAALEICPAVSGPGQDDCLLPKGHAGGHSFDFLL
ncbi:hypothetical protein [Actinoplanes sp. NPDC026670]|uniref:hypothetical protein n=1 Tax=Actinoplanes sp. NPDC026670 TaxID=3154700 RepID=UPI0033CA66B6